MNRHLSTLKAMECEYSAICAQAFPHNIKEEERWYTLGWAIGRIETLEAALQTPEVLKHLDTIESIANCPAYLSSPHWKSIQRDLLAAAKGIRSPLPQGGKG